VGPVRGSEGRRGKEGRGGREVTGREGKAPLFMCTTFHINQLSFCGNGAHQ